MSTERPILFSGPIDAAGHGALYGGWKPSIHMPRRASRITLEIEAVRVERLHDITNEDAMKEGVTCNGTEPPAIAFERLWASINGQASWDADPLVWVVSFNTALPPFKCNGGNAVLGHVLSIFR